jgi:malate synthase
MTREDAVPAQTAHAVALSPWPRTWLFTPADDARKLEAAARSVAGAVIADLEDSVAPERKQLAREGALGLLTGATAARPPPRVVREPGQAVSGLARSRRRLALASSCYSLAQ